jgi:hypothetical protein
VGAGGEVSDRTHAIEPELLKPPPRSVFFYRPGSEGPYPNQSLRLVSGIAFAFGGMLLAGWLLLTLFKWNSSGFGTLLTTIGIALLVFGLLLSPFALGSIAVAISLLLQDRHLVRHGFPAIAEVTGKSYDPADGFGATVDLTYTYVTAHGPRVENTDKGVEEVLWKYEAGDCFTVLYSSKKPEVSKAYQACMFRARS